MPFKSKAQQRFMFAAEERGDLPGGTAHRWAKHTPNIKKLPERKHKKTASEIADAALATSSALRDFYEGAKWAPGGIEYQGPFKIAAELPLSIEGVIKAPKVKLPKPLKLPKAKKTAAEIADMVMKKVAAYEGRR